MLQALPVAIALRSRGSLAGALFLFLHTILQVAGLLVVLWLICVLMPIDRAVSRALQAVGLLHVLRKMGTHAKLRTSAGAALDCAARISTFLDIWNALQSDEFILKKERNRA